MPVQLLKGEFKDPCRAFDFSNLGDVSCSQRLLNNKVASVSCNALQQICKAELKKGETGGTWGIMG